MPTVWQHRRLRNTRVIIGATTFTLDGEGILSPQPEGVSLVTVRAHPNYRPVSVGTARVPTNSSPTPSKAPAQAKPLSKMTKAALEAYAADLGVDLTGAKTNAERRARIASATP